MTYYHKLRKLIEYTRDVEHNDPMFIRNSFIHYSSVLGYRFYDIAKNSIFQVYIMNNDMYIYDTPTCKLIITYLLDYEEDFSVEEYILTHGRIELSCKEEDLDYFLNEIDKEKKNCL